MKQEQRKWCKKKGTSGKKKLKASEACALACGALSFFLPLVPFFLHHLRFSSFFIFAIFLHFFFFFFVLNFASSSHAGAHAESHAVGHAFCASSPFQPTSEHRERS